MNILIIDDEAVIREGIRRTLRNHFPEYRLFLASSPDEAATLLRKHQMNIVLTDILMPRMTGLELMRITKVQQPSIKWVVISAYSEFAYAQEAVRLGARDYMLKPIGKESLITIVTTLSEEIEAEDELSNDLHILRSNRKLLREAVFQRLAAGLDMGNIDVKPLLEAHTPFYLVFVTLHSDNVKPLEYFAVENVLSELVEMNGQGFVTPYGNDSVIGLIKLKAEAYLPVILEELRTYLNRCLNTPFHIVHSELVEDYWQVPKYAASMRTASKAQTVEASAGGSEQVINVALQYMKAHYQQELSLEKVASIVYLHPVYFSQLFKQKTGRGFKEYITQLRMEQAKKMLLNPSMKIVDVAEQVGYQDVRHFTQIFRKKYNVTPSEFRRSHQLTVL